MDVKLRYFIGLPLSMIGSVGSLYGFICFLQGERFWFPLTRMIGYFLGFGLTVVTLIGVIMVLKGRITTGSHLIIIPSLISLSSLIITGSVGGIIGIITFGMFSGNAGSPFSLIGGALILTSMKKSYEGLKG